MRYLLTIGICLLTASVRGQIIATEPIRLNPVYLGVGGMIRSDNFGVKSPLIGTYTNQLKNNAGLGINTSIQYAFAELGIITEYAVDFRYDHVFNKLDAQGEYAGEVRGLLTNHRLALYKTLGKRVDLHRRFYAGVGINLINAFKEHHFYDPIEKRDRTFRLQYLSYSLALGIPIWKLTAEPRIEYVPKFEYPYNPNSWQILLGVRIHYRLRLI